MEHSVSRPDQDRPFTKRYWKTEGIFLAEWNYFRTQRNRVDEAQSERLLARSQNNRSREKKRAAGDDLRRRLRLTGTQSSSGNTISGSGVVMIFGSFAGELRMKVAGVVVRFTPSKLKSLSAQSTMV